MASLAVIQANRENAKKSTGPRTEEGKARSSQNALKHGFTAKQAVMDPIEEELFYGFANGFTRDLGPRNDVELSLVDQIIGCSWRLRRVLRLETDQLRALYCQDGQSLGQNLFESGAHHGIFSLSTHETRVNRTLVRLFKQLGEMRRNPNILVGDQELNVDWLPGGAEDDATETLRWAEDRSAEIDSLRVEQRLLDKLVEKYGELNSQRVEFERKLKNAVEKSCNAPNQIAHWRHRVWTMTKRMLELRATIESIKEATAARVHREDDDCPALSADACNFYMGIIQREAEMLESLDEGLESVLKLLPAHLPPEPTPEPAQREREHPTVTVSETPNPEPESSGNPEPESSGNPEPERTQNPNEVGTRTKWEPERSGNPEPTPEHKNLKNEPDLQTAVGEESQAEEPGALGLQTELISVRLQSRGEGSEESGVEDRGAEEPGASVPQTALTSQQLQSPDETERSGKGGHPREAPKVFTEPSSSNKPSEYALTAPISDTESSENVNPPTETAPPEADPPPQDPVAARLAEIQALPQEWQDALARYRVYQRKLHHRPPLKGVELGNYVNRLKNDLARVELETRVMWRIPDHLKEYDPELDKPP